MRLSNTLAGALMLAGSTLLPLVAAAQGSIAVTGQAEVRVTPDEVIVTFGVETLNEDLQKSKAENDKRTKAVLEAARALGVSEDRLQTDYVNLEQVWDYPNSRDRVFIGNRYRRCIAVRLKDIDKVDALLSAALEAGATHIHGVDFRTTELRKHRDEARRLAIRAAKEKARDLAAELDLEPGQPTAISEYGGGYWGPYGSSSWWGGGYGGGYQMQNVSMNASDGGEAGDSPTALGIIRVSASVSVSFNLQPIGGAEVGEVKFSEDE